MQLDGMMDIMLAVMFFGVGVYTLISYMAQRKTTTLLDNKIICPGGCEMSRCKDVQGFLRFMMPRTLILATGLMVFSAAVALQMLYCNSPLLTVLLTVLPLMLFAWYVMEQRKAAARYW